MTKAGGLVVAMICALLVAAAFTFAAQATADQLSGDVSSRSDEVEPFHYACVTEGMQRDHV